MVKSKSIAQIKVAESQYNDQQALARILQATHHDPFSFLGLHSVGDTSIYRTFLPQRKKCLVEAR